jgi:E3 ubiquitin-protein ligase SHPRH
MGLGKTLMTLMLVASNPCPPDWPTVGKGEQPVQHWENEMASSSSKYHTMPKTLCLCAVPTTLIIAPANLIQQWAAEVRKHFKGPEALSCGIFTKEFLPHAGAVPKNCQALNSILCKNVWPEGPMLVPMQDLDVVLMSYESLQKQMGSHCSVQQSLLHRFGWWRICLDEAQNVARTNSTAAQLASGLARRYAWIITGTPVTTDLDELRGLSTFLSLEPYLKPQTWKSLLEIPLKVKSQAGLLSAWSMLRGVMLRRTKRQVEDQISLPPCTWEDRKVTLGSLESHIYSEQVIHSSDLFYLPFSPCPCFIRSGRVPDVQAVIPRTDPVRPPHLQVLSL